MPDQITKETRTKSWGREMAFIMCVFLGALLWNDQVEAAKVIAWPTTIMLFWSFGVVRNDESISNMLSSVRR